MPATTSLTSNLLDWSHPTVSLWKKELVILYDTRDVLYKNKIGKRIQSSVAILQFQLPPVGALYVDEVFFFSPHTFSNIQFR